MKKCICEFYHNHIWNKEKKKFICANCGEELDIKQVQKRIKYYKETWLFYRSYLDFSYMKKYKKLLEDLDI